MSHGGGTCDHVMRSLTIRKLIVLVAALVFMKLAWRMLHHSSPDVLDIKQPVFDFGLDPAKCVFINGNICLFRVCKLIFDWIQRNACSSMVTHVYLGFTN